MSSEQPRRGREGGSGASPIGSTAAIVIAVIAVVGGFLILRQINDDDDGGGATTIQTTPESGGDGSTVTTLADTTVTTAAPITAAPTTPASTTPAEVTEGAVVVVANASTVDGAAGRFTTALQAEGFTCGDAANASSKVDTSKVYYDASSPTAKPVADYLAHLLGDIAVEELPTPAPVNGGVVAEGTTVLLLLGSDKADKTLVEAGAPTTTVAGAVTTIPAGGATTTT